MISCFCWDTCVSNMFKMTNVNKSNNDNASLKSYIYQFMDKINDSEYRTETSPNKLFRFLYDVVNFKFNTCLSLL